MPTNQTIEIGLRLAQEFGTTFAELARATQEVDPVLSAKALRFALTIGAALETFDADAVELDDAFDLADRLTLIADAVGGGAAYASDRSMLVNRVHEVVNELGSLRRFRDRVTRAAASSTLVNMVALVRDADAARAIGRALSWDGPDGSGPRGERDMLGGAL